MHMTTEQRLRAWQSLLAGLLREVPPPTQPWPAERRVLWLNAVRVSIDLIYGDIPEAVPVDLGDGAVRRVDA